MNDSVTQKEVKYPKQLTIHSMFFISSTMVPYSVKNYRLRIIVKETIQKSQNHKNKVSLTYYQKNHTSDLFPWMIALNLEIVGIVILEKKYYKNIKKAFYEQVGRTNMQNLQQQLLQSKKPLQSLIVFGTTNQNKGKMLASLQVSFTQKTSPQGSKAQVQANDMFTFQLKNKYLQSDIKKHFTQQIFKEEQQTMPKKIEIKPKPIQKQKQTISQNNLYQIEQQEKSQILSETEELKHQLQAKVGKLKLQISNLIQNQQKKQNKNKSQNTNENKNIQIDDVQVSLPQLNVKDKKIQEKKYKVQYTPEFTHLIQASEQDTKSFRKVSLQNIHIRTINAKKNPLSSEPISIAMTFYDISTDTNIKQQILTVYTQIILNKNNDISYLNQLPEDQIRLPFDYKTILIQVIFYHNQYLHMSKVTRQTVIALKAILVKQQSSACRLKLYNKKGVQMGKISLTINDDLIKNKSPFKDQNPSLNKPQKKQLRISDSRSRAIIPVNHIRTKSQNHSTNHTSLHNFKLNRKSQAHINLNQQRKNTIQIFNQQQKMTQKVISNQNSLLDSRFINKKKVKTEFSFVNNDSTDFLKQENKDRYPSFFEKQQKNQNNSNFQQSDKNLTKKETITSQSQNMIKDLNHEKEQKNEQISNKFYLKISKLKVSIYSQYLPKQKGTLQLHLKTNNNFFVQDIPSAKFELSQFWSIYQSDKLHAFEACDQNQTIRIQLYSVTSKNINKAYQKIASREIPIKQILKPKISYKGYLENSSSEPNGQIQFQYQTNKEFSSMKKSIKWKSILVRKPSISKGNNDQKAKTQISKNYSASQKFSLKKIQN